MAYFGGCKNLQELRAEYRRLAKQHHPDMGGDEKIMMQINAEYDKLSAILPEISAQGEEYKPREEAREAPEEYREAVIATLGMDSVEVELCGSWLWCTGNTYPYRQRFAAAGYKWSKSKSAWYWKPENSVSRCKKHFSLEEIRAMHGSTRISAEESRICGARLALD